MCWVKIALWDTCYFLNGRVCIVVCDFGTLRVHILITILYKTTHEITVPVGS